MEFCKLITTEPDQSELNETNIAELNYNHNWGDSLPTGTKGNTIRVVYQNIHRSIGTKDNPTTNTLLENLHKMEADIFLASETNCNWKTAEFRNNLQRSIRNFWPAHRVAFSSSDVGLELEFHEFLPGGTCTMAFDHLGMRVVKAGEDDSGLGRWSYLTLEGQDGRRLTFITGYRICKGAMRGTTTSCVQQRRVLNNQEMKQGVKTSNPDTNYLRTKFIDDLTQFILALQAEGHAIVLGLDANETIQESMHNNVAKPGSIEKLFEETGLREVFATHHQETPDSTTTTPARFIDRLAVFGVDIQRATLLRANEPALSDHLAMVVDVDMQILFNNPCSKLATHSPRKLTSTNPDAVAKYVAFIKKQFAEHRIIERCTKLREASFLGFTERHRQQLFALDTQVTEILLGAENQCSSKRMSRNLWSPALRKAGKEVCYWKRRLRTNGYIDDGTRDLGISLDLPETIQLPMDIQLCQFYSNIAWKTYRGIQKNQREHREKFLRQRAKEQADKGHGDVEKAIKQIRQRERLKQDYASIQRAYGINKRGLSVLDTPDGTTGGRKLITEANEIHSYLLERNEKHYSQATFTPFGDAGPGFKYIDPSNPESDEHIENMLNGVFEPWDSASPYMREWLQELRCTVEKEMNIDLHLGEFIQLFKSIPESTASSVSGLHYGHYKVLSKLDDDSFIRVLFDIVDIAFRTHSPLPRWKLATQLMLEKGKGPTIENLRIIQLLEADMNWLLRYLWGKKLNHHAQVEGIYSEDQYAAPGKLCCSAILNKVLFFDSLRQMRQCGALMDNDATAAFDRVLPALCVVTCRQLGMPKSAQRFFFHVLRQMEYTVTTAHGTSKASYSASANPKVPGQGVIQGGGASQPNFYSQQHPVIKSVERNCTPAIFHHASRLKKKFKRWVGGFSDDIGLFLNACGVEATSTDASKPIAQRVRDALQTNLSRYEVYFNAAGGALNIKKCFYYLVDFVWTGTQWRYQSNSEMQLDPIVITPTTLDNSGTPQSVKWLEANDAQRTLGAFIAPDGTITKQLSVLHDKLKEWKQCLRNMNSRNLRARWLSYQNVFLRKVMYPLIGHSFGDDDLLSVQQPVDVEVLHILGLNEHFPRDVLRAPMLYGGLGCTTIHGQHIIDKLILFVHHMRENKRMAEMLQASMSTTQLECGVATPFFDLDPETWYPLVTPTWVAHLWRDCKSKGIDIKFHKSKFWTPIAPRQHDICIMELASTMYHGKQLYQINQCRIYLQVTYLSDIVSVDGKRILLSYYKGTGHNDAGRTPRLNWPPMGTLPQQHWALWQEFLERWCGTALRVPRRLGGWFEGAEILTRLCFFTYDGRLILHNTTQCYEYLPYNTRSRTRFSLRRTPFLETDLLSDSSKVRVVDVTVKEDSIYIIAQHPITDWITQPTTQQAKSVLDLYAQLPPPLQRIIGKVDWPEPESLDKLATAISEGRAIGVSDGSVRRNAALSSHAWIIHASDGSLVTGMGPVDGAEPFRTSHRAEIQGQAAILLILSLFAKFYGFVSCKLATFCDNEPVVKKMKKGWSFLRLRHTKGADSDLQVVLGATLESLKAQHGLTFSTDWVKAHQDDDLNLDLTSIPRQVALNIRMDADTKLAYDLPQAWLTQECVPVFPQEGCAVYIDNQKLTSALHSRLHEHWHTKEALRYLQHRHGFPDLLLRDIRWTALRFALKKLSPHRRAIAVKALHRHLPTQAKLFQQGRIVMSSRCPRCLQVDESQEHIYSCANEDARKMRSEHWQELLKQLHKNRTSFLILRAWKTHLLPLLGLPLSADVTANLPIIGDEIGVMLEAAIASQAEIGWGKLLLGLGSTVWRSLQEHIDAQNPKPPERSADDWFNSAIHTMIKFSMRCWKSRNAAVHGATKREQQIKALANAREQITAIYAHPPILDAKFRSVTEIPLADRLRLPLQAAEQWLSLIKHQVKVTAHNARVLLKQHLPVTAHFRNMQKIARKQRYERRQPDTPRKAHSRRIQAANKQMRDRLYTKRIPVTKGRSCNRKNKRNQCMPSHIVTRQARRSPDYAEHPSPRQHPP